MTARRAGEQEAPSPARLEVDAVRLVTRLQLKLAESTTQAAILEIALEDSRARCAALAEELAKAARHPGAGDLPEG